MAMQWTYPITIGHYSDKVILHGKIIKGFKCKEVVFESIKPVNFGYTKNFRIRVSLAITNNQLDLETLHINCNNEFGDWIQCSLTYDCVKKAFLDAIKDFPSEALTEMEINFQKYKDDLTRELIKAFYKQKQLQSELKDIGEELEDLTTALRATQ